MDTKLKLSIDTSGVEDGASRAASSILNVMGATRETRDELKRYDEATGRHERANSSATEGHHRMRAGIRAMAQEMANAKSGTDLLVGGVERMAHVFRVGTGVFIGAQLASAVYERVKKEKEELKKTEELLARGASSYSNSIGRSSEGTLVSEMTKAESVLNDIGKRKEEIADSPWTMFVLDNATYENQFKALEAEEARLTKRREDSLARINSIESQRNDIMRVRISGDEHSAKLAEINLKYNEAIKTAQEWVRPEHGPAYQRNPAAVKGIEERRRLEITAVEKERDERESMGLYELKTRREAMELDEKGLTTISKRNAIIREGYEAARKATMTGASGNYVAGIRKEYADMVQAYDRGIAQKSTELKIEREISTLSGSDGERHIRALEIAVDRTKELLKTRKDELEQIKLQTTLAEKQRALDEARASEAERRRNIEHESNKLDIDFRMFRARDDEKQSAQQKERIRFIDDEIKAEQGKGDRADKFKIAGYINQLKGLRNEIQGNGQPVTDFGVSSLRAIGGGGRTADGAALVRNGQEQVEMLKQIDAKLATLNGKQTVINMK